MQAAPEESVSKVSRPLFSTFPAVSQNDNCTMDGLVERYLSCIPYLATYYWLSEIDIFI